MWTKPFLFLDADDLFDVWDQENIWSKMKKIIRQSFISDTGGLLAYHNMG